MRPKVRLPGRPALKPTHKKKAFKHLYELAQKKEYGPMETEFSTIENPPDSAYGILLRAYVNAAIETSRLEHIPRVYELFEQQKAVMVPHMRIFLLIMKVYIDIDTSKSFTDIMALLNEAVAAHLGKALSSQWDDLFRRAARGSDRDSTETQLVEFMNLWVMACEEVSDTTASTLGLLPLPLKFANWTTIITKSSGSLAGIPLKTICPTPEAVAAARTLVYHHIGRDSMATDADRIARFSSTQDFNIVVDAMNLGCAGKGEFNPKFLNQGVRQLLKMGMKPLVMLPKTVDYKAPKGVLVYKCRTKKSKQIVDDHFWLLACMTRQSFFLSNDLLRDHHQFWTNISDARSFAERCQVRWTRTSAGFQFHFPLPWTRLSQRLNETHWAFPVNHDFLSTRWLLVSTKETSTAVPSSPV